MTLRLVTIGPSHYCEKARWALDRAGLVYTESAHLPLVHWAYTLPHGSRTVPVLLGAGAPLVESNDIVAYADEHLAPSVRLYPSDPELRARHEALVARLDRELGPLTRRLAYCFLVDAPASFVRTFEASTSSAAERLALRGGHAVLRAALRRAFGVSGRARASCTRKLSALFEDLGRTLEASDGYLVGSRFGAADVTLASLASPMLLPDDFGVPLLRRHDVHGELADLVDTLRATPIGRHVDRVFREERHVRVGAFGESGRRARQD